MQTDLDDYNKDEASVKLMTMHNAKGLEFEYVFVVGIEDGLIPHSRSIENEKQLEEERRLLYVAITRAKEKVYLSYVSMRRTFNTIISAFPSRFLMEIDDNLLTQNNANNFYEIRSPRKIKTRSSNLKVTSENEKHFKVGQKISHSKFGNGVILNVVGKDENAKLTISFSGGNLKKIMGSFVKLL